MVVNAKLTDKSFQALILVGVIEAKKMYPVLG